MQLLVLKLLYILFTTQGTSEYFYTNDLCVLVDVFLREVVDLDEDSESVSCRFFVQQMVCTQPNRDVASSATPISAFFIPSSRELSSVRLHTSVHR